MNKIWLIILSIIFNLFTILSQSSGDRINNDICFSSEDSSYILKSEKDQYLLNNCEEYPEISPGCIICEDKINEYKKIINVKCVNIDILKPKKKNVFIVLQKNMVDLLAKNVDMI